MRFEFRIKSTGVVNALLGLAARLGQLCQGSNSMSFIQRHARQLCEETVQKRGDNDGGVHEGAGAAHPDINGSHYGRRWMAHRAIAPPKSRVTAPLNCPKDILLKERPSRIP